MNLEVGDVVYIYNEDIIPPKHKYSVCVHVSSRLFFLINSRNLSIYECLPILKENNDFLKENSNIACNQAFKYNESQISKAKLVGRLGYKDMKALYEHIKGRVRQLPKADKEEILETLEEWMMDNS